MQQTAAAAVSGSTRSSTEGPLYGGVRYPTPPGTAPLRSILRHPSPAVSDSGGTAPADVRPVFRQPSPLASERAQLPDNAGLLPSVYRQRSPAWTPEFAIPLRRTGPAMESTSITPLQTPHSAARTPRIRFKMDFPDEETSPPPTILPSAVKAQLRKQQQRSPGKNRSRKPVNGNHNKENVNNIGVSAALHRRSIKELADAIGDMDFDIEKESSKSLLSPKSQSFISCPKKPENVITITRRGPARKRASTLPSVSNIQRRVLEDIKPVNIQKATPRRNPFAFPTSPPLTKPAGSVRPPWRSYANVTTDNRLVTTIAERVGVTASQRRCHMKALERMRAMDQGSTTSSSMKFTFKLEGVENPVTDRFLKASVKASEQMSFVGDYSARSASNERERAQAPSYLFNPERSMQKAAASGHDLFENKLGKVQPANTGFVSLTPRRNTPVREGRNTPVRISFESSIATTMDADFDHKFDDHKPTAFRVYDNVLGGILERNSHPASEHNGQDVTIGDIIARNRQLLQSFDAANPEPAPSISGRTTDQQFSVDVRPNPDSRWRFTPQLSKRQSPASSLIMFPNPAYVAANGNSNRSSPRARLSPFRSCQLKPMTIVPEAKRSPNLPPFVRTYMSPSRNFTPRTSLDNLDSAKLRPSTAVIRPPNRTPSVDPHPPVVSGRSSISSKSSTKSWLRKLSFPSSSNSSSVNTSRSTLLAGKAPPPSNSFMKNFASRLASKLEPSDKGEIDYDYIPDPLPLPALINRLPRRSVCHQKRSLDSLVLPPSLSPTPGRYSQLSAKRPSAPESAHLKPLPLPPALQKVGGGGDTSNASTARRLRSTKNRLESLARTTVIVDDGVVERPASVVRQNSFMATTARVRKIRRNRKLTSSGDAASPSSDLNTCTGAGPYLVKQVKGLMQR